MSDVVMTESVASLVADPEQVRNVFAGWGTHERLIVSILAVGTPEEKESLKQHYMRIYAGNIHQALDSEATGPFHFFVVSCMLDPAERDAHLAHIAILKGDNYVLIEIACTRSPMQLHLVKNAYHAQYKKSVQEDISQATNGLYRELLVYLMGDRYPGLEVDKLWAEETAAMLHKKISEKDYSHDDLILFLATVSKARIKAALNHYQYAFGNDICKDLKAEPNDQFLRILRTTFKCLTRPEKYFEKVLRVAINAQNRDEGALVRVLSTRAEVDMNLIIEGCCRRNDPHLCLQLQMLVALLPNLS